MKSLASGLFEALFAGLLTGAFCFSAQAVPKRLPATSHVFYDQVITFKKGSSELSTTDKETLQALLKTVKERSQKVEQVHVAAWSDRKGQDRELAEKRMNAIQDELEGALGLSYVATYNMAERSNWFAKAMNLNARDVKTMFAQKGAPQNVTPEDFAVVRSKGGPSKAVLLIELESMTSSSDQ